MNELGKAKARKQANDNNDPMNRGQSVVFLKLKENRARDVQEDAHDQTSNEAFHAWHIQGKKGAHCSSEGGSQAHAQEGQGDFLERYVALTQPKSQQCRNGEVVNAQGEGKGELFGFGQAKHGDAFYYGVNKQPHVRGPRIGIVVVDVPVL